MERHEAEEVVLLLLLLPSTETEERQEPDEVAHRANEDARGADDLEEEAFWVGADDDADAVRAHAVAGDGERECRVGGGAADPPAVRRWHGSSSASAPAAAWGVLHHSIQVARADARLPSASVTFVVAARGSSHDAWLG